MEQEGEGTPSRSPTLGTDGQVLLQVGHEPVDGRALLCAAPHAVDVLRTLIVDDDAVFRGELGNLLTSEGYPVKTAPSVAKAVEALETEEFDVVFTDLKMPKHSGMDLLKEIRKRWPRTTVVMITGYATVETALEAMKLGAFDYVRKPFQMDQIHDALRLVTQEREVNAPEQSLRDPEAEAMWLAGDGGYDVLYMSQRKPFLSRHMHFEHLDPANPSGVVHAAESFLKEYLRGALVISGIECLLEKHRVEEIVLILEKLREMFSGHGPLRVAFDPRSVSPSVVLAISGAVAAYEVKDTLEALSNPIRKKVLQRLSDAPASFSDVMKAAGLDDSPKLSFHVRKLLDHGLISHEKEIYAITDRGKAAIKLLEAASMIPPPTSSANFTFPSTAERPQGQS